MLYPFIHCLSLYFPFKDDRINILFINNSIHNIHSVSDSDPDPFYVGQPHPGSKKSATIMKNFHKNQPKSAAVSKWNGSETL